MTILYTKLAKVYHEMYQDIFDYKKQYQFHHHILKKHKCKRVLEIGCGTGNLAPYFLKAGYDYTGMDLSRQMITIARKNNPGVIFKIGDMRTFRHKKPYDAIIIPGRSFAYMVTNLDVMNALKSITKNLKKNGLLVFDNFLAESIFGKFHKQHVTKINKAKKSYKRISTSSFNLKTGWTWDWQADYYIKEGNKTRLVKDKTTLRAFTRDELKLFLELNNFKVLSLGQKGFPLIAVCKKL